MKMLLMLFVVAPVISPVDVHAQGFQLAPGETLVSVNGVAVQRGATSTTTVATQFAPSRNTTSNYPVQRASYTAPVRTASLAQRKANRMASSGTMAHLGGGFGGGNAEGVGTGSTRQAAIQNCCYWGQRTPVDIGAATNGGRWFACVIYR